MADSYVPSGAQSNFADFSSLIADGNAINAATKTALNLALTNISNLLGVQTPATPSGSIGAPHPDFNQVHPQIRAKLQNELATLQTVITNHA